MFLTQKTLPRRRFLRGLGTAVALPFLDAMTPALARAQRRKPPVRMAFVYVPNGIDMRHWNPAYEGTLAELPQTLAPLASLKDDILLLGNLTHNTGRALLDGPGDHGRCCGSYLTGVQVKKTVTDIKASVSCDQLVANQIGKRDALSVARSRARGRTAGGRLRFRLFVCLHEQSCLAQRDTAVATDPRSARAVRAAVRRRRRVDAGSQGAPHAAPAQHPRLRHRRCAIAARRTWSDRSAKTGRVPLGRFAPSRSSYRAPSVRAPSTRTWTSRTESPATSPSTSAS